jgi:hypothetical protein
VTGERRAHLWQRAERLRIAVDTVRAVRLAISQQRAERHTEHDATAAP